MIKTILFDLDGLAVVKPKLFSVYFAEKHGLDPQKMEPFFRNEFQLCLTGKADLKTELAKQLPLWGANQTPEEYMRMWFEYESTKHEEFLSFAQTLRVQGTKCYLQTRNEKYRAEYLWEVVGLKEYFDGMFASPYLGYAKPNVKFWESIHEQLGNPEKDTVLVWDDKQENVDSAKQFGYNAELYTDYQGFQIRMEKYLG